MNNNNFENIKKELTDFITEILLIHLDKYHLIDYIRDTYDLNDDEIEELLTKLHVEVKL